jgi:hypothetical protein
MSRAGDEPDVEIGAVVKAKKLRFKKVPKTDVEFEKRSEGRLEGALPEIETASGSQRENLPDKVKPNKTYRDIYIRWGAAAKLKLPDREKLDAAVEDLKEDLKEETKEETRD